MDDLPKTPDELTVRDFKVIAENCTHGVITCAVGCRCRSEPWWPRKPR